MAITYDTSVIIAYTPAVLPKSFLMSAVVIAELTASANDEAQRKAHEATRNAHEKDGTLIVPTTEDWLMASRVLYWLGQGRKRRGRGKSPRLQPEAKQRMFLDALIAVSARRVKATVVTNNWDDFKAFQYYYDDLKLQRGDEVFG